MKELTKKRRNAFLVDAAISAFINAGVEHVLRKKIKNEAFHALVAPTAILWALEYAQMRCCGQTIGQKAAGLVLESSSGQKPTAKQLVKRMAYRDTLSTVDYLFKKESFEQYGGQILPHDRYAGTVVRKAR